MKTDTVTATAEGRVALYGWKPEEKRYVVIQQRDDGGLDDAVQKVLAPFIGQTVTITVEVK